MIAVEDLAAAIADRSRDAQRFIVAVAGPPGAGKSSLSAALATRLPAEAAIVQADGFHFDNRLLDKIGRRNRKGAPDTFDVAGLDVVLRRLGEREADVVVPVFDRELDVSRNGAVLIGTDVKYLIVEGNYLALRREPWSALRRHFDATVFIEVPRPELERRLLKRWTDLGRSDEAARSWVDGNDLPNVDLVNADSSRADLVWTMTVT
ncbi:MAG TPA: nucleoside/nucleotide kinase family protein [Xanthobacteraceae bacterium]|nr:nucleoside/nucleotide kinase family protein [Xanthobacteraceae bacterium]